MIVAASKELRPSEVNAVIRALVVDGGEDGREGKPPPTAGQMTSGFCD